jgi:hypothetical protein
MRRFFGIGLCVLSLAVTARADVQLITNGGFETGSLAPWLATSSAGSGGSFFENSGTTTPLTGQPTVGPSSGTFYAVSDQFGPGTNALSQSFTVPVGATTDILSYDLFVNDWWLFQGGSAGTARVSLLANGANPITGVAIANFAIVGSTTVVGGIPNPYHSYTFDITADVVAGLTYQIDFVESDSGTNLNMGVDNVSLLARTSSVPEPSSLALLIGVVALVGVSRRFRRA